MRALRLALARTLILMLLGGVGGAVVAEGDVATASDLPHPVSGTLQYGGAFAPMTTTQAEGRFLQRGYGAYDRIEMDDARLSGTLWHVWNRDFIWGPKKYETEGEVLTGTVELVNDEGSWVGRMRGYVTQRPERHFWHIELTGTGAYDGLSTLLYAEGYFNHEVEGFVFPGALPEYPDPVEVPAD
jgi:hypothetical protein